MNDKPSIEALATELGRRLLARRLLLCTAESCTGGGIAHAVTAIAGSSEWFDRAYVTYSNAAKVDMLGVSAATLRDFGAVSEQTAAEMVSGALLHSGAGLAVSVTGIAGPGGGTATKPVGTVCFGWGLAGGEPRTRTVVLPGNRAAVRAASVVTALQGLLELV